VIAAHLHNKQDFQACHTSQPVYSHRTGMLPWNVGKELTTYTM